MSKAIPPVQKFMTTTPHVMAPSDTIKDAHDTMRRLDIRHLPICDGKKCVGILSDGDLFRAEASVASDVSATRVDAVMSRVVYSFSPSAPVDEIVSEMAHKKLSSAVVVDNGTVVGVFTATDALTAFAELLHTRLRH